MRSANLVILLLLAIAPPAAAQPSEKDRRQAIEHLRKGQDLLRAESFEKAREAFGSATRLDPLLELAHYGLGQVAMITRRYPEAVRAYLACREAFHNNAAQSLSDSVIWEQRLEDQVRDLKDTVLALTRGRITARDTEATVGRLNSQIHELEARRHRTPGAQPKTPPWISIALGSAYFRTDAMTDAEREYRAALDVDPRLGEGHSNLAVVLMLTGRYDEADREVRAAEAAGFLVSPEFKADLRRRRGGGRQ